jgi:hypothetical protein
VWRKALFLGGRDEPGNQILESAGAFPCIPSYSPREAAGDITHRSFINGNTGI